MFKRLVSAFLPSEDKANLIHLIEALRLLSKYGIAIQAEKITNPYDGKEYDTKLGSVVKMIESDKSTSQDILEKLLDTYGVNEAGLTRAIQDTYAVVSDARQKLLKREGEEMQDKYSPASQSLMAVMRFATKQTSVRDGKTIEDRSKYTGGRLYTSSKDALDEFTKQIAELAKSAPEAKPAEPVQPPV